VALADSPTVVEGDISVAEAGAPMLWPSLDMLSLVLVLAGVFSRASVAVICKASLDKAVGIESASVVWGESPD